SSAAPEPAAVNSASSTSMSKTGSHRPPFINAQDRSSAARPDSPSSKVTGIAKENPKASTRPGTMQKSDPSATSPMLRIVVEATAPNRDATTAQARPGPVTAPTDRSSTSGTSAACASASPADSSATMITTAYASGAMYRSGSALNSDPPSSASR